jgi:myo-inositol-1-phosphate synthase
MNSPRIGLWFIGAYGSVASTAALGLVALRKGLSSGTGLVTGLPIFQALELPPFEAFVVGGHDVRVANLEATLWELHCRSGVFSRELLDACHQELADWSENVRPGTVLHSGPAVARLANWKDACRPMSPREALQRLAADLEDFQRRHQLDHTIVINLASTEPPLEIRPEHLRWETLRDALGRDDEHLLPASSLYALAAVQCKCSYINFTPSVGISLPGLLEYADEMGILYAGKDGKTGETLIKSVLAPVFRCRNLRVLSWVGFNIFGNRDGLVLDEPAHKASKVHTKDRVLREILGYQPQTHVSIEYIESLDDWKTAWDHIHFEGFLGTKMVLQFIWQGCDSLLAAPLVIDLARLTVVEWASGGRGAQGHLASFFKSPMGVQTQDFFRQWQLLEEWAQRRAAQRRLHGRTSKTTAGSPSQSRSESASGPAAT